MNLDRDSVALVTGASGGIGRAIARGLARAGAKVIVTGRRARELEALAAEIGARVILADLTSPTDARRLAQEVGAIDVLVQNAALPATGELLGFSDAEIDRALDVNLRAPIVLSRHIGERMAERGRGQIVFIASLGGKVASPGTALYSATKFGLRGLSLALRDDLRPHGVGVTTIFPGFIRDAGMFADANVPLPPGVGTKSPEDVAAAVLRAIAQNPAEIDVAPLAQRAIAFLAGLSPSAVSLVQRQLGAGSIARALGEAQRSKR
jgi:short-subunit dehydrogenase